MRKTAKTGTSTSGIEYSPSRQKRMRQAIIAQNKRWAKKSGPVSVRFECPDCGGPHRRGFCGDRPVYPGRTDSGWIRNDKAPKHEAPGL